MLKEDMVEKNPLRFFCAPSKAEVAAGGMGLIMARAGLGKTALLVQIAMINMLRGLNVLHVSVGEKLEKTKVWYDDIFNFLTAGQHENASEIHETLIRHRMIMTFKESSFSRPKLEERLNDLVYQNIFRPDCIVVDGFDFTGADRDALGDIRDLMQVMNLHVWFTALCHRGDNRVGECGVPAPCHDVEDLFETVILLQTEESRIKLNTIKAAAGCGAQDKTLFMEPSTLMVKEA